MAVYIKNYIQFSYENVKIGTSNALQIILTQGSQTFYLLVIIIYKGVGFNVSIIRSFSSLLEILFYIFYKKTNRNDVDEYLN